MRLAPIACLFGALGPLIPSSAVKGQAKAEPASAISPEDRELIDFLLASMKKSRQNMAVGECTATLSYYNNGKVRQDMTDTIDCAFDFPAQNYFMRRHNPHFQGKYISTRQKSFLHTKRGPVTVYHPMEHPVGLLFQPFDIRVLGWTTPHEYQSASYEKMFAVLVERAQWHQVEKDGNGIYQIVFRWGNPQQVEHKLWIDPSKDYVPAV